jgi:hypothetical protein
VHPDEVVITRFNDKRKKKGPEDASFDIRYGDLNISGMKLVNVKGNFVVLGPSANVTALHPAVRESGFDPIAMSETFKSIIKVKAVAGLTVGSFEKQGARPEADYDITLELTNYRPIERLQVVYSDGAKCTITGYMDATYGELRIKNLLQLYSEYTTNGETHFTNLPHMPLRFSLDRSYRVIRATRPLEQALIAAFRRVADDNAIIVNSEVGSLIAAT